MAEIPLSQPIFSTYCCQVNHPACAITSLVVVTSDMSLFFGRRQAGEFDIPRQPVAGASSNS